MGKSLPWLFPVPLDEEEIVILSRRRLPRVDLEGGDAYVHCDKLLPEPNLILVTLLVVTPGLVRHN